MPPPMGRMGGHGGSHLGVPSSYGRRASTCGGGGSGMFGGSVPPPHKKRSIPNLNNKRGSTASGSAIVGLVIPPALKEADALQERRSSRVRIGNSHNSVIDSTNSLYSEEERLNSRLGILPPLIDEKECHHTIVRMASTANPSISQPQAEFSKNNHSELFADIENEDRTSNKCAASKNGTWFHFNLCLGMLGFVIFWLFLMLRIYLPESYWTWSYIW